MKPAAMLAQLAADGAAMHAAAVDVTAAVPTCPQWSVADVLEHTGAVYAHKATVLEGDLDGPPRPWPPDWQIADVREFFDEQLHRVIEALRTRDPATKVWTWFEPDQTIRFWVRRMMQETVIHRADVESAYGDIARAPDEVALDGIDELLMCMLAYDDEGYAEAPGQGERVAVESGDARWVVTLGAERATVERGRGSADATISGRPGDVLLALWNRLPYDAVTTSGEATALEAMRAAVAAVTQ